ncbi:transglycosylase SLT domain-containing protein, partial [Candidatus Curtissbacteria bacterium]|nr:transglycosylase SLT domain-containing protein [Candidatus Curtissbacteria bacterium]
GSQHKNKGKGVVPAPRQVSRRSFLRAIAATVGVSAAVPTGVGFLRGLTRVSASQDVKVALIPKDTGIAEQQQKEDQVLETVFGSDKQQARARVDEIKSDILSQPGFGDMYLAMPKKFENHIREQAKLNGLDGDVVMGVVGIENSGGEDVIGDQGAARGVMQLWEDTARDQGLVVNNKVDERADPYKNIAAGVQTLGSHKKILGGNEGLAVWAFNIGFGRVMKSLQLYFADIKHYNIGSYSYAIEKQDPVLRQKIEKDAARLIRETGVSPHKILANPVAQEYLSGELYPHFEDYSYKVAAIAQLLQEQPKVYVAATNH